MMRAVPLHNVGPLAALNCDHVLVIFSSQIRKKYQNVGPRPSARQNSKIFAANNAASKDCPSCRDEAALLAASAAFLAAAKKKKQEEVEATVAAAIIARDHTC
jgi:hypothetical protein